MARNIELKARIADIQSLLPRARALADGDPVVLDQDDTFFACADGRLKLRVFADGRGELIHYRRADSAGAKASNYLIAPVADPGALRDTLARALGVVARVKKRRLLLMAGPTRIHLDEVVGLGAFLELEVVLRDGQPEAEGFARARLLQQALGIDDAQRVAGAYADLLGGGGDGGGGE